MLFSLLTGLMVTAYFFMKNLIIRIKSGTLFDKKKNPVGSGTKNSLVIYCEGKQYWNVFKPVVEELSRRNIPCDYYTSGEDDPGLNFSTADCIKKEFIGKGNAAYRFLNFLEADICLMTTPGLDVFQLKRSPGVKHYAHIVHMVTDTTTYRLFSLDFFDSVFLSGPYQAAAIRALEALRHTAEKQLYVVGCTYLDVMMKKLADGCLSNANPVKTVLVAPSWGPNGLLSRYGLKMLEPLAGSGYHVIIRPHPQSMLVEKVMIESLQTALKDYKNIEWNFDTENLKCLSRSDVMISDFSGVIFDYAFLFNRPVCYTSFQFDKRPYDASDIDEEPWVFRALKQFGTPIGEENFSDLERILDKAVEGAKTGGIIEKLKTQAWASPGEAGRRTVDRLLSIMKIIVNKTGDQHESQGPETEDIIVKR
jgi:hypothetical protein